MKLDSTAAGLGTDGKCLRKANPSELSYDSPQRRLQIAFAHWTRYQNERWIRFRRSRVFALFPTQPLIHLE
ncbi:hypothetical protein ACLOJK_001435, partial [Asimina triloba]